jgi:hypothetical protein
LAPDANPFSPGAGSRPPELAGRQAILAFAQQSLARVAKGRSGQYLLMLGLRGVGKTVLLNEVERIAETQGYLTSFIEAPEDRKLAELIYPLLRQVLRKMSLAEQARQSVNRAFGALRNFASAFKVSVGEVEIGVEPTPGVADSGDMELDLTDLFLAVGEAAQLAGKAWLLLIDEVQYLSERDLAALIVALHRANQKGHPIYFAGAGLPQLARLAGDAKSYAERLFSFPSVGALSAKDAREAIVSPLTKESVDIEILALDEIVTETGGYPFYLQEWAFHAWNAASRSPITAGDVRAAGKSAINRLDDGFFKVRLDRLTNSEAEYVNAMAALGHGPYKSTDVAKALNKTMSSLGPCRASIIAKGMIYSPNYGEIDFTVPLFDQFLRRKQTSAPKE